MKQYFLLVFLLLLTSCGLFSSNEGTIYSKSTEYQNTFKQHIPTPWQEIKNDGSDFAIRNSKSNSTILLNSSCRKNDNGNLNSLTTSILSGIENVTIISKKNISLYEREAIEIKASGKLDGITVHFLITTLQKNFCVYDYVLISSNAKKLEQDSGTYSNFLNGIKPL